MFVDLKRLRIEFASTGALASYRVTVTYHNFGNWEMVEDPEDIHDHYRRGVRRSALGKWRAA